MRCDVIVEQNMWSRGEIKLIGIYMGLCIKMKTKSTTVGTVLKSNRKIVEKDKIDTPYTHIHDWSLSWLVTYTSIKSGEVKLVLFAQCIFLEIWNSTIHIDCKYFF